MFCFVRIYLLNPTVSENFLFDSDSWVMSFPISGMTSVLDLLAAQLNKGGRGLTPDMSSLSRGVEDNSRRPLERSPIPLGASSVLTS